eukprot:CAMPEP_0206598268 /NCGR_PEP_ID=MMETSP0325_2-20121206/44555_1 /ASSEMBLY_ACC=CAM_ASM_000347 /TAXON_ID=2866 /ORGANISM="Crypthecodinium cohnii, Strain Seligo" /LENGTH=516 /DNA_ID=CAMNT_0054109261 /DNA_START=27 /DNA_END=1578 /DNA_ORIENTATION=+
MVSLMLNWQAWAKTAGWICMLVACSTIGHVGDASLGPVFQEAAGGESSQWTQALRTLWFVSLSYLLLEELRGNWYIMLLATSRSHNAFRYASKALRNDRAFVLAAVTKNGMVMRHAGKAMRRDPDFVLAAVVQNGVALSQASSWLRRNVDFMQDAVEQNIQALCAIPQRQDHEFVLEAVRRNEQAILHAHRNLRTDRNFVLAAAECNGKVLKWLSPQHRSERDIVLAGVGNYGLALQFAPQPLRDDRVVLLAAVRNCGSALQYSRKWRDDREVVLAAVSSDGTSLQHASWKMQTDREIALIAARQSPEALTFLRDRGQDTSPLAAAADSQLALQGEHGAPVVRVELELEGSQIKCSGYFVSGRFLQFSVDEMASVGDLAAHLVDKKPEDMQAFVRVFLVIDGISKTAESSSDNNNNNNNNNNNTSSKVGEQHEASGSPANELHQEEARDAEREGIRMTPWDYDRPLRNFVRAKRAAECEQACGHVGMVMVTSPGTNRQSGGGVCLLRAMSGSFAAT